MKRIVALFNKKHTKSAFANDYLITEMLLMLCFIFISLFFPLLGLAQSGKDGARSYTTAGTYILNRYTYLTANASAGATTITVNSVADLSGATSFTNSTNPYTTAALSPGDLIFIIKIQGADITTTDDANYGNITNYNGVGNYEFKTVYKVRGNVIEFCDGLTNAYTVGGRNRVQVIRVPRLTTLNISGGADRIVSALPWDGTIGGICVIETSSNITFADNAAINVNGLGFRGGSYNNASSAMGITIFRSTNANNGAIKGEGIAGNQSDYNSLLNGQHGRGAPANGGGGGNAHNAGGGGGSNAGSLTGWNGTGTKPTGYNAAWNLESAGFATDVSPGGGRGGYSYSGNDRNAITEGPGNTNWGGDNRRNVGGFGGRPLDYNTNTRLFFGGGGGAGDGNNNAGGGGGNGGGIVFLLCAGNVSGTGFINANGNNGVNTSGSHIDAPGGGGGGGAVVLLSAGTISGITINANGGNGGNQLITSTEAEGPGGGGGGGYILTTTTSVTRNANGGNGGTTTSSALTEFPPNGATNGTAGTIANRTYFEPISCFNRIATDGCGNGFVRVNTKRVLNGDFSLAITSPAPGNTYTATNNATAGTIFNFAGGSFRSQSDREGGSADHRFDIRSGNYTSGSINQDPFPGDPAYAILPTNTWMHHNGNNLGGEALIWEQTLSGLTVGTTYTFYFYASNVYNISAGNDPAIQVRIGGTAGIPTSGTILIPAITLDEDATSNSQPLSGWIRISQTFTATATSHNIKITNTNTATAQNEVGITAIGLSECVPICSAPRAGIISAANTIVNSYYAGAVSVSAGATQIILGEKNTEGGISENIQPGDLLLVMQMQGSTINTSNNSNYGGGTGTFNGFTSSIAGNYEYVYAASHIVGNVVTLATPLINSYTAAAATSSEGQYSFQVIRVADYTTLMINWGASITAPSWNGSTGGVVAINASGAVTLPLGTGINVNGKGFRGGGGRITTGNGAVRDVATSVNSSKGEGIAGTPRYLFNGTATLTDTGIDGYPQGSSGFGAPANAGGGNSSNGDGGGGGGSNYGAGGRGGRAWSTPTVNDGGYGGASLNSIISQKRLFMGGGGGAGTTNNGTGSLGAATSSGAAGGGIILINCASVSGTSTISANGNDALSPENDGAGGGGAGGSVHFFATNPAGLSNITIFAKGGKGGDAWSTAADNGTPNDGNPEHGPGGGGGGGIIYASGTINSGSSVVGGNNGITTTSNLAYYATGGANGLIVTSAVKQNTRTKVFCDIDSDDDGIIDNIENINGGGDPYGDEDNDGILNMYDRTPGGTIAPWVDANNDGINDNFDADRDGVINMLDLDSDNDGVPDVIEAYGVDANGDGLIDNFVDANGDGLSDNVSVCDNLLSNPSFETPVQTNIGNNITGSNTLGAWTNTLGDFLNIVRTNGSFYGGGPDNAQSGRQYLDINGAAGIVEQSFTLSSAATINFGGFFSSRESSGYVNWTASIQILTPANVVVATSTTRNFTSADGTEDQIWYNLAGSVALTAGTYKYRINIGDYGNFDNAYVFPCNGGLRAEDFDGDGIPNYLDLDSDNDGIPDIVESGGADTNNDGRVDGFVDNERNGFHSPYITSPIITTGADINSDGKADSWPVDNLDRQGLPNLYDLDSDGDGITDAVESGLIGRSGTNGTVAGGGGIISGTRINGWANTVQGLASLNLNNSDSHGNPDYLDIDSDNDGITDNVEAQATSSYVVPTLTDSDGDGIADIYESAVQQTAFGGNGLTPFDFDGDGTPDYRDTDTDNDGAPDRNEGDRNLPFRTITQATINAGTDTDGDGLMDVFDNVNITTLAPADLFKNVTMGNMGPGGNFEGPTPTGSLIGLQQSNPMADRDWRNLSILPLNIIAFNVVYDKPFGNLTWKVENEIQTSHYEIEYSENGVNFKRLAVQNAVNAGTFTYNYVHNLSNYNSNIIYYRIKQVDKDGKVYFTDIKSIKLTLNKITAVYPNPFESLININYHSTNNGNVNIKIFSTDGKLIYAKTTGVNNGINSLQVTGLEKLSSGNYILLIENGRDVFKQMINKK